MQPSACVVCDAAFTPRMSRQVCCSDSCRRERHLRIARDHAKRKYVPASPLPDKPCALCGVPFTPYRASSLYCGDICKSQAQNERKRAVRHGDGRRDCVKCGATGSVERKPGVAVCDACKVDPRDPDKMRAKSQRRRLRRYGLTPEQYDEIWRRQGSMCVCGVTEPGPKGWCIDHCHDTGKVRGILCNGCNITLGHAQDDPHRLRVLAHYLESPPTSEG